MKKFGLVAAADLEWGIGKDGRIPWHFPEDFKWFKKLTMESTCFMGYNTYAELALLRDKKKELLPGRNAVVISSKAINDKRIQVCRDIEAYEDFATDLNFFIGGTRIFEFAMDKVHAAYITRIPLLHDCDTFFPKERLVQHMVLDQIIPLYNEDGQPTMSVSIFAPKRDLHEDE